MRRVEIHHQRIFTHLPAKDATIDVECEARDSGQIRRLIDTLQAEGFAVEHVPVD